ncbi:cytochrome P450 2F2-like [Hyperolius riggenbachi]|uniref:cytochrome P450 2F2-like n=1 Tax=Hyperolius riggenbachi TaxID=752182 RepID=UPI0035A2B5B0
MDWSSTLLLLVILFVSYIFLTFLMALKERASLPPGPMPLPFIGNLLQIDTNDIGGALMKLKDKYGPIYTLYLGSKPGIVLCGYQAVKEALIDQHEQFADRGDYPGLMNFIGGHDLCFHNGEKQKELRRFALLSLKNLGMGKRSVEEQILQESEVLIKELKNTKGALVDPRQLLACASSNVICSMVFGKRLDYTDKTLQAITTGHNHIFTVLSSTWGTLYNIYPGFMEYLPGPHRMMKTYFQLIFSFLAETIKNHEDTLDPENPRDYIDYFLTKMKKEVKNPDTAFYKKSLACTCQNLLFGGTQMISNSLRCGLLVLMKHPDVAEKMQEEIDSVVGRNRPPSIADRSNLPYTEAAIHEIVRFCDFMPTSLPRCTAKDTRFRGYLIPKGTYVTPLLASVHADPDYYDEPNKFNPNRFLDEKGAFKKNDAHLPFGAGSRLCIGESLGRMEIFLYFTVLLQNFTFKPIIPKEEINVSPVGSGLGNILPAYKCRFIPR